ncbi:porin [Rhodopseudomonas pseudopalustris]|uniref:Porin n=2 Tax=Rhodopseudomonas TaxID=1073 RepID=Q135T3_RHOPS|nr:conserved hypothetical protein [Rhodopseudomonas palustris BisB5]
MRMLLIAIIGAALPVAAMGDDKRPTKPLPAPAPKQAKGNPCAAFGAGFAQVEGSSTCVRIGGALEVGVGGSSRR